MSNEVEMSSALEPQRKSQIHAGKNVNLSRVTTIEDEFLMVLAGLMEGGQDDEDTCQTLDALTQLLSGKGGIGSNGEEDGKRLSELVDSDGFDTIVSYLDMRQGAAVRGHATIALSAYLKASGQQGADYLSHFFKSRVRKGTYDDFIVAFSVASAIFPIVPDLSAELFLSDGFVNSLGSLMKRKWKSKKVEQSCLDMLNVACMDSACREAIQKHCTEWLEEIVNEGPWIVRSLHEHIDDNPMSQRQHSPAVRNLAAVILAKLQAVPKSSTSISPTEPRIQPAITSAEELTGIFINTLANSDDAGHQSAIEGLAYASLQPKVKEKLAFNPTFLTILLEVMKICHPRSPMEYGGLSILVNLTTYMPSLTEEQKKITQLKAYANASKESLDSDALINDEHVTKRCKAVFDANVIPVLVTNSQHGSPASLKLVVQILFSLSKTTTLRGRIAQQGGVKLLLHAYSAFPSSETSSLRLTAHALAQILISTNPLHVFGGSNPIPLVSAIRPLLALLSPDPTEETKNLLPTFESLLALTNLASTDDSARDPIIRDAWPAIEDLLLSNNKLVTRATVELICNLMQSPHGVAKFCDGSKAAGNRLHILLALADAEDFPTRRAAGGALASLTEWDEAVKAILARDRGIKILLAMCVEEQEEMRHRGVVCVLNVMNAPGDVGKEGIKAVRKDDGIEKLKQCAKLSRSQEVVEITVECLKKLLGEEDRAAVAA